MTEECRIKVTYLFYDGVSVWEWDKMQKLK